MISELKDDWNVSITVLSLQNLVWFLCSLLSRVLGLSSTESKDQMCSWLAPGIGSASNKDWPLLRAKKKLIVQCYSALQEQLYLLQFAPSSTCYQKAMQILICIIVKMCRNGQTWVMCGLEKWGVGLLRCCFPFHLHQQLHQLLSIARAS